MRKYDLDEIDRMRAAVMHIYRPGGGFSEEDYRRIEDQLRTYMANGTDPVELETRVQDIYEQQQRIKERMRSAAVSDKNIKWMV